MGNELWVLAVSSMYRTRGRRRPAFGRSPSEEGRPVHSSGLTVISSSACPSSSRGTRALLQPICRKNCHSVSSDLVVEHPFQPFSGLITKFGVSVWFSRVSCHWKRLGRLSPQSSEEGRETNLPPSASTPCFGFATASASQQRTRISN